MTDSLPLATMAMTTYNHAAYVRDALEAALAQTYSPLEILVHDDASSDDTFAIVEEIAARYDGPHKLTVHRNPENLGMRANCRQAFDAASGTLIFNVDGDDISKPERVARTVEAWLETGTSVLATNAELIDETGKSTGLYWDGDETPDLSLVKFAHEGAVATCFGASLAFEKRLWDKYGPLPDELSVGDILIPFWGALENGNHFIMEPLVGYRVHGENASLGRIHERAEDIDSLAVRERIMANHIAHTAFMINLLRDTPLPRDLGAPAVEAEEALMEQLISRAAAWSKARRTLDTGGKA